MSIHRREEVEVVKDELRCRRSDGKQWRCSTLAMSGRSLCEKHFNKIQSRQQKKKDGKAANKKKSVQAVSSFAHCKLSLKASHDLPDSLCKPKANDGSVDCQSEQKSRQIKFDEKSGSCKSAFVISGHNMEAKAPTVDIVGQLKSLTRMTLALLLQNLTSKDFIKNIVTLKVQRCKDNPGVAWKVFECNPYILGGEENPDMYLSFLNHLCELAEKDHSVVDGIFGVAEKGNTGEGDRIEYLFRSFSPNESRTRAVFEPVEGIYIIGYSRQLPSPQQWGGMRVCVHLTMSEFVKGEEYLSALKGAALPIAQLLPT